MPMTLSGLERWFAGEPNFSSRSIHLCPHGVSQNDQIWHSNSVGRAGMLVLETWSRQSRSPVDCSRSWSCVWFRSQVQQDRVVYYLILSAWTAPSLWPIKTTSSTWDELVTRQQDEPELRQTCLLSRCPHSLEQPTSISHLSSDHQSWNVQVAFKNWTSQPGFPTLTRDHHALAILHFVNDLTCDINRIITILTIIK